MSDYSAREAWPPAVRAAEAAPVAAEANLPLIGMSTGARLNEPPDAESSIELVERLRTGDSTALERLFARYLLPLRRWAHGRLPPYARSMDNTEDIVQSGIVRVLSTIGTFRAERPGGFHSLLRTAIRCEIIDKIRAANRRPLGVEIEHDLPSRLPSPYELALEQEDRDIYEQALELLCDDDRELVIGRLEWGMDYAELGASLPRARTAEATRIAARRAVVKLAEAMESVRQRTGTWGTQS